jgi:hypothetical protein
VNANKLKNMTPVWRKRFLTWGIIIAVFGMRIVFLLLIVVMAAKIGPLAAIKLVATRPEEYARIMQGAHLSIAAFGGTFLMMVALGFFCDPDKDVHWFKWIEGRMVASASIKGIEVAFVLILLVDTRGAILDRLSAVAKTAAHGGLGGFLYLEVLDASFSFDGVIGAFALSQNLFVIAIGLGIGAMYVRTMTIMLVERGTLSQYRYLEHGAFYAILALSVIMFTQTLIHIPEAITSLGGAVLIGVALLASIRWNRANRQ